MMLCGGQQLKPCAEGALKSAFWRSHLRYRATEVFRALQPLQRPACELQTSRHGHKPTSESCINALDKSPLEWAC